MEKEPGQIAYEAFHAEGAWEYSDFKAEWARVEAAIRADENATATAIERERCAKVAEAHRCGEQLIRLKMSEVDQVGAVSMTIAAAIRALGGSCDV